MDTSLLAFLLAASAAVAVSVLIYRRRELDVRGRGVLAGLRASVLVLLLLLVWNPQLPRGLAPEVASDAWVLLDRSLSMGADPGAWEEAIRRARGAGAGARLVTFGSQVRVEAADALASTEPDQSSTLLATALERAAEAGARTVTVVSDLRVRDGTAATAVLRRIPARVTFARVGGDVRNAGLAEALAPRTVESGQPVPVELVVQGEGGEVGDSVTIEVREDGRLVASERAALPGEGRQIRSHLDLPAPDRERQVRYTARVSLEGDAFPPDDERVFRVDVGPEVRGAVLLSLRPTWEPRFLLPVLQQVTGLTARGYLALADGRFLAAGGGLDDRTPADEPAVRQAMAGAELLVLHGVGSGAPDWVVEAAASAGRLLVFAHDPEGAALAGVDVADPVPGEWYPVPELPASPLASDLSGADFSGLPPLTTVLPLSSGSLPVPLGLLRDGRGRQEAALALNTRSGRRRAAVLASGFWRWGFREGRAREAYRRLWAAVSGWLLATQSVASGPGVRPSDRVLPRDEPVEWRAPGLAGDTVALQVRGSDGVVLDTTLAIPPSESFRTNPLSPGEYSFVAGARGVADAHGSGAFDIESFTDELLLLPVALDATEGSTSPAVATAAPAGRPLRTYPAPYLVLLTLLCVEWIARRRLGLR